MRLALLGLLRGDRDVVDPALELRRSLGGVVRHQDPVDRLARGDRAEAGGDLVPLVDVEALGVRLALRGQQPAVAVGGLQLAQVRAVGEGEVHRDVRGRVVQVRLAHLRIDEVGQLGVLGDGRVHVEDLVVGVGASVGRVRTRVPQCLLSGESRARLRGGGAGGAAVGLAAHLVGHRRGGVTVRELNVGELERVRAAVRRDLQPEVLVRGVAREVVALRLVPLGEGLAAAGVEVGPLLAVRRALERPVLRVAFGVVVGRSERVRHDLDRFVQIELDPAGLRERQPLGARFDVDEVLLDLAAGGVLGARAELRDPVGDIARYAGGEASVDAGGAGLAVGALLDGVAPVRLLLVRLEGGGERPLAGGLPVRRRGLGGGDRGGDHHQGEGCRQGGCCGGPSPARGRAGDRVRGLVGAVVEAAWWLHAEPFLPGKMHGQRCHSGMQGPVGIQVTGRVKGVAAGLVDESAGMGK
ncbi:hypothetical protein SFIMM107S_05101 [Streptomyces griseus]